jgi:hypothetical protein
LYASVYLQAFAASKATPSSDPLTASIPHFSHFYQTDAISRASKVMAKCVKARQNPTPGVHGASVGQ